MYRECTGWYGNRVMEKKVVIKAYNEKLGGYENGKRSVFAVVSTEALLLELQFARFLGELARCATESGAAVTA